MNILVVKTPILPYSPFACIYKIHFGRGEYYIGSTTNMEDRMDSHANSIKNGSRSIDEYIIRVSSTKYTVLFEILEEITDLSTLTYREQEYLDKHINDKFCLNVRNFSGVNNHVKKFLSHNPVPQIKS